MTEETKDVEDNKVIIRNIIIFLCFAALLVLVAGLIDNKITAERNTICEDQLLSEMDGTLADDKIHCTSYPRKDGEMNLISCKCNWLEQINDTIIYAMKNKTFSIHVIEK